jgi:hypothetical protein
MAQMHGRKAALIAELEMCRAELRTSLVACGQSLNVVQRVRESFRTHAMEWCTAGAVCGLAAVFLVTKRIRRPRAPRVEKHGNPTLGGTLLSKVFGLGLGLASDLLRPVLSAWVSSMVTEKHFSPPPRAGRAEPRVSPVPDGSMPDRTRS